MTAPKSRMNRFGGCLRGVIPQERVAAVVLHREIPTLGSGD